MRMVWGEWERSGYDYLLIAAKAAPHSLRGVFIQPLKPRMAGVEIQLSAMGQRLVGLTTAVYSGRSELDDFRRRLECIERRLDFVDTSH
jgi:hypothetical protein